MLNTSKTVWDLNPLFKSDDDPAQEVWRKKVADAIDAFAQKWEGRTDWLSDPKSLKEALGEYEELSRLFGTAGPEGYYIGLRQSQEEDNTTLKAKANKIEDFARKNWNKIQFFLHRLAKVEPVIQNIFLKDGGLSDYNHFLELLFLEAKHLLSEAEEKIMTAKGGVSHGKWVEMTSTFVSESEGTISGEKKSFSEVLNLIDSTDKKIRDEAAREINSIFAKIAPVGEAELNAILENKRINDELRGFARPDASRHMADDIPTEAVDALLSAVEGSFGLAHQYYALKAKLFGVQALEYHERNVPYGSLTSEYPFEKAVDLVYKTFGDIDAEFASIFKMFVEGGQMDVFPRKGKSSGAFCAGDISYPTYILLNHGDKLRDVTTIAHEAGHGINNELMRKKQNALNFGTPLSVAEVASTFMEDFVLERLAQEANDEERLAIYMMKLNDDVSTIFRQSACYRFEQDLHNTFRERGYLSKAEIGALFQKNMESYMGPSVIQSPGSENWWVYWGHIRNFFYVYSYVSGLIISKAMQAEVKKDKNFITKVKEALSLGASKSPAAIFKDLGIDIANPKFWESGIMETKKLLEETESLAKRLGKIK